MALIFDVDILGVLTGVLLPALPVLHMHRSFIIPHLLQKKPLSIGNYILDNDINR